MQMDQLDKIMSFLRIDNAKARAARNMDLSTLMCGFGRKSAPCESGIPLLARVPQGCRVLGWEHVLAIGVCAFQLAAFAAPYS